MRLVMVMKVRDEADVLEHTLRYHSAQGVDAFVVTDNGSSDGTAEILRRWERAGRLRPIFEPATESFREEVHWWVTRMARLAGNELDADWVIHADADEFWWAPGRDLKRAFAEVPGQFDVVVGPRSDFVARPDGPAPFWERMTARQLRTNLRPKLAHRPYPDIVLHGGAHDIDLEGGEIARAGRPVLRNLRDRESEDDGRLVYANVFPARVLHLPLRSFDQYDDDRLAAGVRAGRLVIDERLRDFLPRCPDPTSPEPAGPPPRPAEDVGAELADLAFEGMRALSRQQQYLIRRRSELRGRLGKNPAP